MTDDTVNVDMDDLDAFEDKFYDRKPEVDEVNEQEDVDENEEVEVDENEDDSLATEDEDVDEVEEDEDEEIVEVPQLKKRNRVQERIEQLLERERLANEKAHALELRLSQLEAGKEVNQKEVPSVREQLSADAPNPDAIDDKGDPLYKLGEFDPLFIRDLTKFTIEQETKSAREKAEVETRNAQIKAGQEEIRTKWIDNLEKAEIELPDIRDNIRDLTDTFADLDPAYGEYLASTLMNSDVGPQVMNYLSHNIGEAQKIVASGPVAATLALGRLEAKFTSTKQEDRSDIKPKKVSSALPPPQDGTRGRRGNFAVAPDTDDLDAFEREFFKRR